MTTFALPADFTIVNIDALAAQTLGILQAGEPLSLDLQHVEHIDTAAVQLLLVLKREARERAADFRLRNVSEAAEELIAFYHLEQELVS